MFVAFSINAEGGDQHQVIADVQPVEYRALFLHSIVERLLRGLLAQLVDAVAGREGVGLAASAQSLGPVVFRLQCNC